VEALEKMKKFDFDQELLGQNQNEKIFWNISKHFNFVSILGFDIELSKQALWIRIRWIRMFFGLPDPDPSLYVRIWVLPPTSKHLGSH
jgi:hypothetical protein